MTPYGLDVAIRHTLLTEGRRAVQVIARRTASEPESAVAFAVGGVAVALVMLRTMSIPDRISWVAWSWALCFVRLRLARRNRLGLRMRARRMTARKRLVKAAA